jgi:outer membrane immunogenic protein
MKKLLLAGAAVGAVILAGAANAADLRMPLKAPPPPPPVFSWSGCYVGAHWGWGWGKPKIDNAHFTDTAAFTSSAAFGRFDDHASGPIFGGQVGCNYQWPSTNFVIGVEGSYSGADINGERSDNLFPFGGTTTGFAVRGRAKVDQLAAVTGRIGWNGWDPMTLFYIKGGWGWGHAKADLNVVEFFEGGGVSTPLFTHLTGSRGGWTLGGGVEWAFSFAPRWSAFIEYLHYETDKHDVIIDTAPLFFTNLDVRFRTRVDTVRVGVNYKLFSPFGP